LRLDVVPVFAPPQESGFQAAIENFNGRCQAKVWARFYHDSLADLQERSRRYVSAYRQRAAARIDGAPERRPFPTPWQPDLQAQPDGVVIFIRRTSATGTVNLLGRTFEADPPTARGQARETIGNTFGGPPRGRGARDQAAHAVNTGGTIGGVT